MLLFLLLVSPLYSQDPHPAETYGWGFSNFGTPSFSWDIYRNSFYGIPVDSSMSWFTAPFDKLFYDLAFETTLSDPSGTGNGAGNCFGLSILSMMINKFGGYKGYCAPTIQYSSVDTDGNPTDLELLRAINIMHGHQISLAFLQSVIDQVNGGHALDATYGVTRTQQDIAREGPVLLSVTKSLLPTEGGHAIIAYDVINEGGGKYKIMVVDPNRIWADTAADERGWYLSDSNFVEVDGHDWRFRMAGALTDWPTEDDDAVAGGSLGEGNLTVYPLSVAGPTSRTPSSLGLGVTALVSQVFIMNKGDKRRGRILQVYNGEGKRLFSDPDKYLVDWNKETGICRMAPFYPMASPPNGKLWPFELYFHHGPLNSATVDFNTGEGDAEIVIGDNRGYVRLQCDRPNVSGQLRVSGLGSSKPTVFLEKLSDDVSVDIEMLAAVQPGSTNRVWKVSDVTLSTGNQGHFGIKTDMYGGIAITGITDDKSAVTYYQASNNTEKNFFAETIGISERNISIDHTEWIERKGAPGK